MTSKYRYHIPQEYLLTKALSTRDQPKGRLPCCHETQLSTHAHPPQRVSIIASTPPFHQIQGLQLIAKTFQPKKTLNGYPPRKVRVDCITRESLWPIRWAIAQPRSFSGGRFISHKAKTLPSSNDPKQKTAITIHPGRNNGPRDTRRRIKADCWLGTRLVLIPDNGTSIALMLPKRSEISGQSQYARETTVVETSFVDLSCGRNPCNDTSFFLPTVR